MVSSWRQGKIQMFFSPTKPTKGSGYPTPKPGDENSGQVSAGIDTAADFVTMEEEKQRDNFKKEEAREHSIGLGYRVPLIIASPWTRGGWVNSEVCDITSTIQFLEVFLERKTGKKIKETNISDWRRTVTGDLTSAFRPYNGETIQLPAFVEKEKFVKEIYNARFKQPPSDYRALSPNQIKEISRTSFSPLLPGQEPGIRPSNALPYELIVDGKLTPDKKGFQIEFNAAQKVFGNKAAGAAFNVYTPGKYKNGTLFEEVKAWAFAVKPDNGIQHQWPLQNFAEGLYHLNVYGPNGFFREFKGTAHDPEVNIRLLYEEKPATLGLSGNIIIEIEKPAGRELTIFIRDQAYKQTEKIVTLRKNSTKKKQKISLKNSFGWYDISVKVNGHKDFEKRYAGRVETGEASKTDPLMGRVL